jgi:hypothetical protein
VRRSFNTAVPVTQDPHPVPIREAIAQLVSDYHPTQFRSFQVERHGDWARVTAFLPSGTAEPVVREVILED